VTSASFHVMTAHILGGTETNDEGLRAVGLHDRDSNSEPVMYVITNVKSRTVIHGITFRAGCMDNVESTKPVDRCRCWPFEIFLVTKKGHSAHFCSLLFSSFPVAGGGGV
jgi:hypothetical protein